MPPPTPITVVIARFDDLFARGLGELLESDRSLAVLAVDVAHRRIDVVLRAHRPDVAILDLESLAKPSEVRELSGAHPGTRLILLGNDPEAVECAQLLAFGASACLDRGVQSRDVISAIHLASRGLQVHPRPTAATGGQFASGRLLTKREGEVLTLLQQGRANAQIALALQVGVETVRTHARNIYRKLGVRSRRELAAPSSGEPRDGDLDTQPGPNAHRARRPASASLLRSRRGHGQRERR